MREEKNLQNNNGAPADRTGDDDAEAWTKKNIWEEYIESADSKKKTNKLHSRRFWSNASAEKANANILLVCVEWTKD